MTCIIAIREPSGAIVMASDSAVSTGDVVQELAFPKVMRLGDALVGAAGTLLDAQIILTGFTPPQRKKGQDVYVYMVQDFVPAITDVFRRRFGDDSDPDSGTRKHGRKKHRTPHKHDDDQDEGSMVTLLVAYHGRIFNIGFDGSVVEVAKPYAVIGSGTPFALGALAVFGIAGIEGVTAEQQAGIALTAAAMFAASVAPPFTVFRLPAPPEPKASKKAKAAVKTKPKKVAKKASKTKGQKR